MAFIHWYREIDGFYEYFIECLGLPDLPDDVKAKTLEKSSIRLSHELSHSLKIGYLRSNKEFSLREMEAYCTIDDPLTALAFEKEHHAEADYLLRGGFTEDSQLLLKVENQTPISRSAEDFILEVKEQRARASFELSVCADPAVSLDDLLETTLFDLRQMWIKGEQPPPCSSGGGEAPQ